MTDRIAVVGAGQMGNGIAHVFSQHGFPVTMIDVSQAALEKGVSTIAKNLERQVKKGSIPAEDQEKVLSRIDVSTVLDSAAEASLVIEAASEDSGLKFRIFTDLDRIAKHDSVTVAWKSGGLCRHLHSNVEVTGYFPIGVMEVIVSIPDIPAA